MAMESPRNSEKRQQENSTLVMDDNKGCNYMGLVVVNYLCLLIGSVSSSLVSKYYFIHKGSSRWVSTWVQCGGFPLLLLPVFLSPTRRRPFTRFSPRLAGVSVVVGLLLGVNNLLFSWGNSYLPVSTSSLLLSSQLLFTLLLSALIVKQRITFSNLNCVVLLTLSSALLAVGSSRDRRHVSLPDYFIGFSCTVGAGLLFALYLPVMERVYREVYCFQMVVEMQLLMEASATALATAGMASSGGFREMAREAREVFDQGERAYWLTLAATLLAWQLCFMGTAGMVFLTSSITGGICMTALLAINVLAGVLVYGDNFGGVKAVSTLLCCWGFSSYVYGMYVKTKQDKEPIPIANKTEQVEMVDRTANADHVV